MQLYLNHPPPGVAHNRTGKGMQQLLLRWLGLSRGALILSWPCSTYHQPVLSRPPLISKEPSRSAGGLFLPLFLSPFLRGTRHCSTAPRFVARQLRPPPLAAGVGSFLRGRVVSLDLRPRGRLMGRERRSGSTTTSQWTSSGGWHVVAGCENMWECRGAHASFADDIVLSVCLPVCSKSWSNFGLRSKTRESFHACPVCDLPSENP